MAAIEFVVRSTAGALNRGFVGEEGAASAIAASAGADISLNLTQGQIVGYKQDGANLIITLIDGREIEIQNFFGPDNQPVADLFISADGLLSQVELAPGMGGTYYGNYVSQDVYGKWSPNDDLYFVHGDNPALADAFVGAGDDAVGMLGGIVPIWGLAGLPLLALLGGGGDVLDDDDEREDPEGRILEGTKDVGHVVNEEDHSDGVDISGTGTPGATVNVTINGHTQTTIITTTGTWTVRFPPTQIDTGTYETPVVVVVIKDGRQITINDILVVDTEVNLTFDEDKVGGDGTVNAVEQDGVVILSGTVEANSAVTVVINSVTYTAVVTGTTWSLSLPAGVLPEGELTQSVTITAVDQYDNSVTITGSFTIDTFTTVTINSAIIGGNGLVNAAEHAAGTTITGTAQAGASVVVTVGTVSHTVIATAAGTWSAVFTATELVAGTYTATVTAVATDQAGNTATATGSFGVDTGIAVTIATQTVETDGMISGAERADGVTLTGTADAGATVVVTFGSGSVTTVANAAGQWSAFFLAGLVPQGELTATATAVASDSNGNTATASGTIGIDTIVDVDITQMPGGADEVVNFAERGQTVTITGTVEVGSSVTVILAGVSANAVVAADGTWTATFNGAILPQGETTTTLVVNATDAVGNTASISETVEIDTIVEPLTLGPVTGDDLVNRDEALDGITLTGTVEPGSTLNVTFEGVTRAATVAANGTWTVTYAAAEVPAGEYTATVTLAATDAAGNTRTETEEFEVDTTPPDAPLIESYTREGAGVRAFTIADTDLDIDVHAVSGGGNVTTVGTGTPVYDPGRDELGFNFTNPIPNGSHLVMTATDATGNATSTLFVLEEALTNTVNIQNAGYDRFNIEAIDLQFAEDSSLTLTAADLEALAAHSNTLTIHGGVDDTVNIIGAAATGDQEVIGGRVYDVYSLGTNGGMLIIDEAITVNT